MDDEAAGSGSGSSGAAAATPAAPWVYVANHTLRHDPSHLVSHRAVMELTHFMDAVIAPVAAAAAGAAAGPRDCGDPWVGVSDYGRLLLQLDAAVSDEVGGMGWGSARPGFGPYRAMGAGAQ
ncbi:hypothetical protein GPECTOR_936g193 [Gonium pectorale]|uniref:Uncharacterized protein n=1 Tax=Gonium pectorale TaxID=33097 RepID=A0A150FTW7_GONPE|nr:hypothetical protein GPECTOR_936g193 [Gonium pectorale]|eukprot:KXZ41036.1 hypothetical protein GPECTOR_936g193 [Gonium pectorale]